MKFFGKLATTLLSLSFCFSAFGCANLNEPPVGENSGNNNGGSSGSGEQEQTQTVGESLANAIMGQLEEANTLTFSLELKTSVDNVYKAEEEKENNSFDEELISYEFTLAKTEKSFFIPLITLTEISPTKAIPHIFTISLIVRTRSSQRRADRRSHSRA